MSIVAPDQSHFLVMAPVGSSHEAVSLQNTVTPVAGGSSVERVGAHPGAGHILWAADSGAPPPPDWAALAATGIKLLYAVPIRSSGESSGGGAVGGRGGGGAAGGSPAPTSQLLGVLNLGFKAPPDAEPMFGTYLHLMAASITPAVKEAALGRYLALAADLQVGGGGVAPGG
jgi:hypothetical protein